MTQTRSRTATIKDNVLEEISGKLSSLDDIVTILTEYIQKLDNSVQCFQVKFNEFIPNEPIENECDFVKKTSFLHPFYGVGRRLVGRVAKLPPHSTIREM